MNETSAVSTGALTSESLLAADSQVTGYLTFNLSAEEYGLDILKVQEIKRYEMLARLPDAASYVKGVFNLRGKIVPVVDMRVRFNLANVEYGEFTVMIILNVAPHVRDRRGRCLRRHSTHARTDPTPARHGRK